jgi:PBSX family phage terminase large subunit
MILYSGGYGCGKTLLGCYWAIAHAMQQRCVGAIFSPTIKMLIDNILNPHLLPLLNYLYSQSGFTYHRSFTDFRIVIDGSEIRLRPFNDEGTLRGSDLNWIWIDEAIGRDRVYLTKYRFEQIRARLRQGENQQMLITTNPGSKNHFLYQYFTDKNNENRSIHYGKIYDNRHLGADYIEDMEQTYSSDELNGLWTQSIGAVYDEFSHEIHVKDPDVSSMEYYLAIDFGTDNPFACLLVGVDTNERIYIIDEIYLRNRIMFDLIEPITDMINDRTIEIGICDNNRPDSAIELQNELDIPIQRVNFKQKYVMSGINKVKKLLRVGVDGQPSLYVSPRCENTIREFETYTWDRTKDETGKDRPLKRDDHAMDALRYLVSYLDR